MKQPKFKPVKEDKNLFISYDVLLSDEFLSLNGTEKNIYIIFLYKRQFSKKRSGKNRSLKNNGDIQFSENEAIKKWNIPSRTFKRAIAKLIAIKMIAVSHKSYGFNHDVNLYELLGKFDGVVRTKMRR